MQKMYQGTEPYVFVSYSHKDKDEVFALINHLMLCSCNVWYDVNLESGNDWNEQVAEKLLSAECVLLLITKNSVQSEYVRDEINFARSKGKKIFSVFLENVELPLGLELMLGRSQAIAWEERTQQQLRDTIRSNLPESVFKTVPDPFYVSEKNLFYIKDTSYVFPDGTYFEGEKHNSFEIRCINTETKEDQMLFRYQADPGFDMECWIHEVSLIDDPYFNDQDSKLLLLYLCLSFSAKYPVPWPDVDLVLSVGFTRLDAEKPRIMELDCKCAGEHEEKEMGFISTLIKKVESSFSN